MAQWIGCKYFSTGRDGRKVSILVPHISEAPTIGSIDNTFNGSRQASTHYAVDDINIHQYVNEADTAWAVGNWDGNCRSISIECIGTTANPPSRATLDNCARLMVDIANRHGLGKLVLGQNVKRHKDFAATSCPSTLDLDYLMAKVAELQGGAAAHSTPITTGTTAPSTDVNVLAQLLASGYFGNGRPQRQAKFNEMGIGHLYEAAQDIVNKGGATAGSTAANDAQILELAKRMERGEFGDGRDHRQALFNQMGIGELYPQVQALVNKRAGL